MLRILAKGRVLRSSYTSTQLSRVGLSGLHAIVRLLLIDIGSQQRWHQQVRGRVALYQQVRNISSNVYPAMDLPDIF